MSNQSHHLSASESQLLLKINEGFSDEFWQRFHALRQQLEDETITETDRQEFLKSYAAVEAKNAERMDALLQLARLRGTTLPNIMQQLGICPLSSS